jgi:hypothetical protein
LCIAGHGNEPKAISYSINCCSCSRKHRRLCCDAATSASGSEFLYDLFAAIFDGRIFSHRNIAQTQSGGHKSVELVGLAGGNRNIDDACDDNDASRILRGEALSWAARMTCSDSSDHGYFG